jgi:hypothetical protein
MPQFNIFVYDDTRADKQIQRRNKSPRRLDVEMRREVVAHLFAAEFGSD